jgi:hypothetical protein
VKGYARGRAVRRGRGRGARSMRAGKATQGLWGQVVKSRGIVRGKRTRTGSELNKEQNQLGRKSGESRGH